MDMREARREARAALACHARYVAEAIQDGSPDGVRIRAAYTDLAQFLDPQPLVVPEVPGQLALDVGVTPTREATP